MDVPSVLTGLLMLAGLIVANALFVAAEYALVSIRKSRVDEMVKNRHPSAATVHKLKSELDRSIAGSQMGITIASLSIGWLGGLVMPSVAHLILGYVPGFVGNISGIVFAISFVMLSLTQVIIGEQIPKQIALRLPEQTIVKLSKPFRLFCWVMSPLIWLMSVTAALALRAIGIQNIQAGEHPLPSSNEFQILFEESEKAGHLGKQESDLLRRALELKALCVRDVMVPRAHMDMISETLTLPDVLAVVSRTKHSKLPVYGLTGGVVGILHTRDLFDVWGNQLRAPTAQPAFKVSALVRRPFFVPDSMLASALLEDMKARQLQMAIVVDEFGATVGLITLEDLIEQLVGEIWDEYDKPNLSIQAVGLDKWHVQGELTLFEFNKAFDSNVDTTHSTTIAGAFIETVGHQPEVGDSVTVGGYDLEVLEMKGQAVTKLQVKRALRVGTILGVTSGNTGDSPTGPDTPRH